MTSQVNLLQQLSGNENNQEYFSHIIKDNTENFINTLDNETKHFNEHKNLFYENMKSQ